MVNESGSVWVIEGIEVKTKILQPFEVCENILSIALAMGWNNLPTAEEMMEEFDCCDLPWTFGDAADTLVDLYDFGTYIQNRVLNELVDPDDMGRSLMISYDSDTFVSLGS